MQNTISIFKAFFFGSLLLASIFSVAMLPSQKFAFAADDDIPKIESPVKATNLSELITKAINVLLSVIAMASVIMIIVSGFRMVGSGGNPGELSKAKSGLIWAILGLVVAIMSFSIISIIQRLIK